MVTFFGYSVNLTINNSITSRISFSNKSVKYSKAKFQMNIYIQDNEISKIFINMSIFYDSKKQLINNQ